MKSMNDVYLLTLLFGFSAAHADTAPIVLPSHVQTPDHENIENDYLARVQKGSPAVPLTKDWTRNLIVNSDFGAGIKHWDSAGHEGLKCAFINGSFSYHAIQFSGPAGSGIKQDFSERLKDFLETVPGRIKNDTGILLRLQYYAKSTTEANADLTVLTTNSAGDEIIKQNMVAGSEYKLFTLYFRLASGRAPQKAELAIKAPVNNAPLMIERVELRALAPIAKHANLGEAYPRWMSFRNGTNLRVADLLANGGVNITHALRPGVVTTLRKFKPTEYVPSIDHENFMNISPLDYRLRAWNIAAKVNSDVLPDTTTLKVEILMSYADKPRSFWAAFKGSKKHGLLLSVGDDGRPDVKTAERVEVISAQSDGNKSRTGALTIKRSGGGTRQTFRKGHTYFARILKAYYNPANPHINNNGKSAKEVMVSWYDAKYKLTPWQGIEFDTAGWYYLSGADTDLNFVNDGGVFNGINTAGLGAAEVMQGLREHFGNDFIIQCDGHPPHAEQGTMKCGYQEFQWINGVEMESYTPGNHSTHFEFFRHIQERIRFNPVFNYALIKDVTARYNDPALRERGANDTTFQAGLAAACLLGMVQSFSPAFNSMHDGPGAYAKIYRWDEYYGGDLKNQNWLGKPVGPMLRSLENLDRSVNLLDGVTWILSCDGNGSPKDIAADLSVSHHQNNSFTLAITKIPEGLHPPRLVSVKASTPLRAGSMKQGSVYTWVFKARAKDWVHYNQKTYKNIPMALLLGVGEDDTLKTSVLVSNDWRLYSISFIAGVERVSKKDFPYKWDRLRYLNPKKEGQVRTDDELLKMERKFEEYKNRPQVFQPILALGHQQGEIEISELALYEGDDACWYREFENGLVMHNAGILPWTVAIPAGFRKLTTANSQPYNNGEDMSGKKTVIKTGESLFLVKNDAYERLKKQGPTVFKTPPLRPDYYSVDEKKGTVTKLSDQECQAIRNPPEGEGKSGKK
jgi:hypothetical protein